MFWDEILGLVVVATIGHVMAAIWYAAYKGNWSICDRKIYDTSIQDKQMRRELKNSLWTPMHAVILAGFLYAGFFASRSWTSFFATLALAFVWAELWHYVSHRAMHLKALDWIHAEHHKSHVNGPITAISFSFSEKLIFDLGYLGALAIVDVVVPLNFHGIVLWYVGYLVMNSFGHANFEFRPGDYNSFLGKLMTSTTYHSLHHARYTHNYGLATRFFDRLFSTEWTDYEKLFHRVVLEQRPMRHLRERAD
jgi:lathosterol oxidase